MNNSSLKVETGRDLKSSGGAKIKLGGQTQLIYPTSPFRTKSQGTRWGEEEMSFSDISSRLQQCAASQALILLFTMKSILPLFMDANCTSAGKNLTLPQTAARQRASPAHFQS